MATLVDTTAGMPYSRATMEPCESGPPISVTTAEAIAKVAAAGAAPWRGCGTAAVRRLAYEAADTGLLSPELAAGIREANRVRRLLARLLSTRPVAAWLLARAKRTPYSPIANADGRALCRAVRSRGRVEPVFVEDVRKLDGALAGVIEDGDLVVTMGAGNISAVSHELPARLRAEGGA